MSTTLLGDSSTGAAKQTRPAMRASVDVSRFRIRVKAQDRVARWVIVGGGIGIIAAVLGIGVSLFLEALPLFQPAKLFPSATMDILPEGERAVWVGIDEHQEKAGVIGAQPEVLLADPRSGARLGVLPLEGIEGDRVTSAAANVASPEVAVGTAQGRIWRGTIRFDTRFEVSTRRVEVRAHMSSVETLPNAGPIRALALRADESGEVLAAVTPTAVIVRRTRIEHPLVGPEHRESVDFELPPEGPENPTALLVSGDGREVLVGTDRGNVSRWRLPVGTGAPERLETIAAAGESGVTAMAYLIGERSVVIGAGDGGLSSWSLMRLASDSSDWRLTRTQVFQAYKSAVAVIAPSPRDKGFLTASMDGQARFHYRASGRTLAEFRTQGTALAGQIAPKANGVLLADGKGRLQHFYVSNPHPEFSFRSLFGKVWYEGYAKPDYIWQSSGATDDFEPKLSLVPLVFGTLKGTFYALLFAVPIALFAALYCSQFLEKRLRNGVKSAVELMTALPSVILGFIAGVVLAPLVQHHVLSILLSPIIIPGTALAGLAASAFFARGSMRGFVRKHEFLLLVVWLLAGLCAASWAGPAAERLFCGGNFEAWLLEKFGTRYDQRNSMIVGWTMGFAVVPVIFTLCDDAFSSVPRHWTGASLACGASLWQTAWRVVLPAAGSGVFSAVMVGLGRAVGETMIVLMATGNTPIMDGSLFNGFRALSANIAVEIPEAPHGGTLYRVLFLTALLLFAMTAVANTAAEVVRLRLRNRLKGIG